VDGISRHRGLDLRRADLHLITSPSLRLDQEFDKERLAATVAAIRPRLLLLDPFVRLHRSDENDSGAISAILADLRTLQRTFDVAVLLVHHSRKNGRGPQGYALRGSGDLYAWGDAYAYLSRRTAPSSSPSSIDLDPPSTPSLSGSCRAPMAPPLTSRSTLTNAKVQPPPLSPSP
jgi:RecA-family ATPase